MFQSYLPGTRAAAVEQWLQDDSEPHTIVFHGVPCLMTRFPYPHKTIATWHQAMVRLDKTDPKFANYSQNLPNQQVVIPIFRHVTMSVATSLTFKCTGWSRDYEPNLVIVPDSDMIQHIQPVFNHGTYNMLASLTKVTDVSQIFRNQLHQSRATHTPTHHINSKLK